MSHLGFHTLRSLIPTLSYDAQNRAVEAHVWKLFRSLVALSVDQGYLTNNRCLLHFFALEDELYSKGH
jgi:hypothetical protein